MCKHLTERFQIVKVRVLHPRISKNSSVAILRGVPEGSRLSPTLFGIFVADLINELKANFPNATITGTHNGGLRWIGGILCVDDLVSDLNRCPRTPDDDKHMSDLERKGPNTTQR